MEMWALCYFLYIDHRGTVVLPWGGGGSISNFECPPFDFFTTAGTSHYYTYMYTLYRALRHSCRTTRPQIKIFCPTCTIADRYT